MRNVVRTSELNRYRNNDSAATGVTAGEGLIVSAGSLLVQPSGVVAGSYNNGLFTLSSGGQITSVQPGLLVVRAALPTGVVAAGKILFSSVTYTGPNPGFVVDSVVGGTYTAFTCVPGAYFVSFDYSAPEVATDQLVVEQDGVTIYQGAKFAGRSNVLGMCLVHSATSTVITARMVGSVTVGTTGVTPNYRSLQIIKAV